MEKELLIEFIKWAEYNSPDAWYIYDKTEDAINKFFEQRN